MVGLRYLRIGLSLFFRGFCILCRKGFTKSLWEPGAKQIDNFPLVPSASLNYSSLQDLRLVPAAKAQPCQKKFVEDASELQVAA